MQLALIDVAPPKPRGPSLATRIAAAKSTLRALYLEDTTPWIVGYSGGKDSTATLQLVWEMVSEIAPLKRHKPIHVISTDTGVENPVVSAWVQQALRNIERAATVQGLPIEAHALRPSTTDSFWVNLIGKGYAAPRTLFRWCTDRLKIRPSNRFILEATARTGRSILILGTRRDESSARAARMDRATNQSPDPVLVANESLPGAWVHTPIAHWSTDEVWQWLIDFPNPWETDNHELLAMYRGATADNECPLVVGAGTPSCGDSRFGCWVCTLVEKDRSMQAMIANDAERHWMTPLMAFRDLLDPSDDHALRDFRRLRGHVQIYDTTRENAEGERIAVERPIPGPYLQAHRERLLSALLEAQVWIRRHGPAHMRDIELIDLEQLEAIRRIWLVEKHEMEDRVPAIYKAATGARYPGREVDDHRPFDANDMALLLEACDNDPLRFELMRELLDIERRHATLLRRAGIFDKIEAAFTRSAFADPHDAIERAKRRRDALHAAHAGDASAMRAVLDGMKIPRAPAAKAPHDLFAPHTAPLDPAPVTPARTQAREPAERTKRGEAESANRNAHAPSPRQDRHKCAPTHLPTPNARTHQ